MTDEDLAKLEMLVREAKHAAEGRHFTASLRDELAFSVPKLVAEVRQLRALLARHDVQRGSCDGCGLHCCCPICGAENQKDDEGQDATYEPHMPDCPLAPFSPRSSPAPSPPPAPESAESSRG